MAAAVNRFKRGLLESRQQIGIWSALASHYTAEIMAGAGFDWIMLDTEHAPNEVSMVLQQLQAVAAAPDRIGVFIGPADLAASLGYPGNPTHPAVRAAIDNAIRRIKACGKARGILMVDETRVHECLALGAMLVAVAVDMMILSRGADAVAARCKSSPNGVVN